MHLLGPRTAELANLFALTIRLDLISVDLKKAPYPYPTAASDIGYMA